MKKNYLNCKKITTAIDRAKKLLKEKAAKNGVYENFGQDEINSIRSLFIDISDYTETMNTKRYQLEIFENWCSVYHNCHKSY